MRTEFEMTKRNFMMRTNCFKATIVALFALWLVPWMSDNAQAQTTQVVGITKTWKYNKTGNDPGATWTSTSYNDSGTGWEGPGLPLFGFEGDAGRYDPLGVFFNTTFPDPQNPTSNFRTNFYFRTHF